MRQLPSPRPRRSSNREFEPEPLVLQPPIAFEPLAVPPSNGATLDDYFDRLSAAFEEVGAPPARPFQPMPERLEDLAPMPPPRPPTVAPALPADEWPAQEWLSPRGTMLSFDRRGDEVNPILEAVTALMAEGTEDSENGSGTAAAAPAWPEPPAAPPPEPPAATQQAIVDAITERVMARLVPEVAATLRRLVEQEIARKPHDIH